MLAVNNLTVRFGTIEALTNVSFKVEAGEFVTLIGPSGSGKSTLFNVITGLLAPTSGSVMVHGMTASHKQTQVGYMPQRDLLMPWRTLLDNVVIPLDIKHTPRRESYRRARALLPQFGLEGFEQAYPETLSGGMRQRAALLRTFLTDQDILLLDEPFGALDALTRRELQSWLLGIWKTFNRTILFITHDVQEAVYLSDRVLVLSERPGRIREQVRIELPRPRQHRMVADPAFGHYQALLLQSLGISE